jgi:hypothetical protein
MIVVSQVLVRDESAIIPMLLLVLLGTVLGFGIALIWLVRRYHFAQKGFSPPPDSATASALSASGNPLSFEPPGAWLVIRSHQWRAIQVALGLHRTTLCSWSEGAASLGENQLFVSSPIGSWTLVIGPGLPNPAADIDQCFHFLTRLSAELGHVDFFWHDRALSHHAWAQAECGQIIRAYAWAEQTLWNQGAVTAAEKELGMCFVPYGQRARGIGLWGSSGERSNTGKLQLLARRWSLDPAAVPPEVWKLGWGITGEVSHSTLK